MPHHTDMAFRLLRKLLHIKSLGHADDAVHWCANFMAERRQELGLCHACIFRDAAAFFRSDLGPAKGMTVPAIGHESQNQVRCIRCGRPSQHDDEDPVDAWLPEEMGEGHCEEKNCRRNKVCQKQPALMMRMHHSMEHSTGKPKDRCHLVFELAYRPSEGTHGAINTSGLHHGQSNV